MQSPSGKPVCLFPDTSVKLMDSGYSLVSLDEVTIEVDGTTVGLTDDVEIQTMKENKVNSNFLHQPSPTVTIDSPPSEFIIGQPVELKYSWQFNEDAIGSYNDGELVRIFDLHLPSEFTSNLYSDIILGDIYSTHTMNRHILLDTYSDLKSGSGIVTITMTEQMMYNIDYARFHGDIFENSYYQTVKTENGAKLLYPARSTSVFALDPHDEYGKQFEIYYDTVYNNTHTPIPRPVPKAQSNISPDYLEKYAWDDFAEFIKFEQSFGNALNVTQYLISNGLSQQFIDDYLTAYPEFQTQGFNSDPSGASGPPLNIFASGTYHMHNRDGIRVPASGLSVCIFDVNMSNPADIQILPDGLDDTCSIISGDGYFSIFVDMTSLGSWHILRAF